MRKFLPISRYKRLMGEQAWSDFSKGSTLGMLVGVLTGCSLLVMLPASVALETSQSVWGLDFGGWLIALAVLAAVCVVIDYYGTKTGYIGALGFMRDVHYTIGNKVARLPLGWFNAGSDGRLSRLVTQEMMSLAQSAAHSLYKLTQSLFSALVICVGSWFWDWRLGLLLTLAVPVLVLVLWGNRKLVDAGKAVSEPAEQNLSHRIVEFGRSQGTLRSAGIGADYPELERAFDDNARLGRRGLWLETSGIVLSGAFTQIIVVAMILITVASTISGNLTPLQAIVTIGISLRFTTLLEDLGAAIAALGERNQMMDHIDEILDTEELPEIESTREVTRPGAVSLRNVTFGYEPSQPVVRDVSFDVEPGHMCALIGPSGSGKTTIARLISRFYDVDEGQVLVGGIDVRDQRIEDLMAQLSMVFQDVYLYDDTLLANIRVGNPTANDEEIAWAAELAGVSEIAERLPGGWQARVGEGGRVLSGGERQRVSIARALIKKAPIVLLDEATSALDAENEAHIVESMNALRESSTLIVIAHKLETVKSADSIVVLDDYGRVEQVGSHTELIAQEGRYRSFWQYRNAGIGWTLA
ncbi:ABC transporter ATP-binding protein [Corynebacterium sp. LK2510]|uniref:ABC transporter ATP-binding protein n=1 Tax=Corynebacterium sp. LK2510 TaxID=3110472 RepID=UPI0034CF2B40